jgi:hypothetical protein
MAKRDIPEPFAFDEIKFRQGFSAPSYRHFVCLLTGWVMTVGIHTISRVILTMGLERSWHFASVYRFLSGAEWTSDSVSEKLFIRMVEVFVEAGAEVRVVLDDTLNRHRGRKICGAALQHDGAATNKSRSPFAHGLCFVVIGVAVRLPGISRRVFCLPFGARLWWPQSAKVKPGEAQYKTKPELGLELIEMTRSWLEQDRVLRLITDISYCCETIIKGRPQGVHITGRVRKDSSVYDLPAPRNKGAKGRRPKKGKRLPTPQAMFEHPCLAWERILVTTYGKTKWALVYVCKAIWYRPAGDRPVLFVLVRDPGGSEPDAVFFDTDCDSAAKEIIERYACRWSIEITNREVKQLLGSADPQCRTERSVFRAPMIAHWAYSLVVVWFVSQWRMGKRFPIMTGPWYGLKKDISFADMLAAARRSRFSISILEEARERPHLAEFDYARCTRCTKLTINAKL